MADDQSPVTHQLRKDALGLVGTVSLTAAYMAPAASLVALFGVMVASVGTAVGSVMLLALLITLPSAVSFGMMARELPSAGGVSSWARITVGRRFGDWAGLCTAIYFLLTVFFPPIVFGQLTVSLVSTFSPSLGESAATWIWALGVIISLMIAAYSAYRGIEVSSRVAFAMLVIQFVVMTALAVHFLVLAVARGGLDLAFFAPSASPSGWSGLLLALPLAMLSLVCDAAVPVSEETRDAKRTIPLAILLTLLVVGVWNVLAFSALATAAPPAELLALSQDPVTNPVPLLAGRIWGAGKVVITLVGMIAMLGALVPCSTAASRLLYSLARDGTLPRGLSWIHPRYQTPWHSLHAVFVLTLLAVITPSLIFGPNPTIAWWGNIVVWFILVVYFTANLSNLLYYWRHVPQQFNPLWNLFCPLLAMLIQVLVAWQVVIKGLWELGWMGWSAQIFILVVSLLSALHAGRRRGFLSGPSQQQDVADPESTILSSR